jgi:hypothetical protein
MPFRHKFLTLWVGGGFLSFQTKLNNEVIVIRLGGEKNICIEGLFCSFFFKIIKRRILVLF